MNLKILRPSPPAQSTLERRGRNPLHCDGLCRVSDAWGRATRARGSHLSKASGREPNSASCLFATSRSFSAFSRSAAMVLSWFWILLEALSCALSLFLTFFSSSSWLHHGEGSASRASAQAQSAFRLHLADGARAHARHIWGKEGNLSNNVFTSLCSCSLALLFSAHACTQTREHRVLAKGRLLTRVGLMLTYSIIRDDRGPP